MQNLQQENYHLVSNLGGNIYGLKKAVPRKIFMGKRRRKGPYDKHKDNHLDTYQYIRKAKNFQSRIDMKFIGQNISGNSVPLSLFPACVLRLRNSPTN